MNERHIFFFLDIQHKCKKNSNVEIVRSLVFSSASYAQAFLATVERKLSSYFTEIQKQEP